jgi:hypothetical protein
MTTVFDCNLISLEKYKNRAGNLSAIENLNGIPFNIDRVFYLYDIPGGESRGAHAHIECHQLLIAASGSFTIELNDGINKRTVNLNRPNIGLHIPPTIWAAETNFSSGAICLVLASHMYNPNDYIRDYAKYIIFKSNLR